MERALKTMVLIACATASLFAAQADAKTGVVFIHGKGGASLADVSVSRAYWTEAMISATTK
ncbi:MAG: hypothetical protein ABIT01_06470, partial [Thermoanaerobaculia bacterium]